MKRKTVYLLAMATLLILNFAFKNGVDAPNTLNDLEKKEGWQLLFDGKSTKGWHLYNMGKIPSAWIVTNDELFCKPDTFKVEHGDLVTDKSYSNYDLKFEWKITEAGNSGIFINVQESPQNAKTWSSGVEYQLLDQLGIHKEYLDNKTHWAGCLYGFQEHKNAVTFKPAGEWNEGRIKQMNGNITYWMNGVITAQEDLKSSSFKKLVANSNFKYFTAFDKKYNGRIALQDWSKGVSFRNLKIREL